MTVSHAPSLNQAEWSVLADDLRVAFRMGCSQSARRRWRASAPEAVNVQTSAEPPVATRVGALRSYICATDRGDDAEKLLLDHGFNPDQIDAVALLSRTICGR